MSFTDDELELLRVIDGRKGVQSLSSTIKRMSENLSLDASRTPQAWAGLVAKGKLRRIDDDTAEVID